MVDNYTFNDKNSCIEESTNEFAQSTEKSIQYFKVYPNPTSNSFKLIVPKDLRTTEKVLKIYNVTGSIVQEQLISAYTASLSINTTDLKSGVYWITIGDGKENYTEKITIIK